jgi:hypothetical protein
LGLPWLGLPWLGLPRRLGPPLVVSFVFLPRGAHFPLELVSRVLTPSAQALDVFDDALALSQGPPDLLELIQLGPLAGQDGYGQFQPCL